jgi:hypothetical protein
LLRSNFANVYVDLDIQEEEEEGEEGEEEEKEEEKEEDQEVVGGVVRGGVGEL